MSRIQVLLLSIIIILIVLLPLPHYTPNKNQVWAQILITPTCEVTISPTILPLPTSTPPPSLPTSTPRPPAPPVSGTSEKTLIFLGIGLFFVISGATSYFLSLKPSKK